ncbi:MAG: FAD-dependent oxidoreductase [Desulfobacterales bacterium]|nr:FAD-dependent oxidoreductase [Desulfobacterales bacterium]
MKRKKIAIIGSGISGLTCGYYLSPVHDIILFEAEDYIGGHTHTVDVEKDGEQASIDTGFIVFNERTYPNFIRLIREIGVPFQNTEMSFSVANDAIDLEYNGTNLDTLFAQRANLLRPRFWKMLTDILRFNKDVRRSAINDGSLTIGEYLVKGDYSALFRDNYLLPMISAVWSMGLDSCLDFPLQFFIRFFDNHGLLNVTNRPRWLTIKGGSSRYIPPLIKRFEKNIKLQSPVTGVTRQENKVLVESPNHKDVFDEVILACHGDQAFKLLSKPTDQERSVIGAFRCTENQVVLHTDVSPLPKRRKAWASWNYRMVDAGREQTTLTYNMNILQRLNKRHTYLVTLNQDIREQDILARFTYSHPVYTTDAINAQELWHTVSGVGNIHYCGAYWFNGFHEDGVRSALRVCETLGVTP